MFSRVGAIFKIAPTLDFVDFYKSSGSLQPNLEKWVGLFFLGYVAKIFGDR
jgi:hypothetical protein